MTQYFIFKRDNLTGKITPICNGSRRSKEGCEARWYAYMCGFMDALFETIGAANFSMTDKDEHTFNVTTKGRDVDYFMCFDQVGHDLIYAISNE